MDVAMRCKALRFAMGYHEQISFAALLGIAPARWGNFERGYPLSIAVAHQLVHKCGITLDWLYYGHENGLSLNKIKQLRHALKKAISELDEMGVVHLNGTAH